jgi:ABC-2 type transport system ATP-binding protein
MYGLSKEAITQNSEVLLRLMELKASSHLLAEHLSGGMKRRLDIACALIHNPQVLIMDEPTADLDPVLRSHVWEVVKRINARGTTVILSSHHLNDLDTLCNRIAILKDGKLVDIDTPEKLKSKYSRTQELMIETFPGNYEEIIKRVKQEKTHDDVVVSREGMYLKIKTENPEHLISKLLLILSRMNESLIDLKLVKPNLDNVFVMIYKKAEVANIAGVHPGENAENGKDNNNNIQDSKLDGNIEDSKRDKRKDATRPESMHLNQRALRPLSKDHSLAKQDVVKKVQR